MASGRARRRGNRDRDRGFIVRSPFVATDAPLKRERLTGF
jgi:hypothetical protein